MPPRPLRRPAAVGRHPRDRGAEEGEAREGRRGVLRRRPAAAGEEDLTFEEGGEVAGHQIPVGVWRPGFQLLGVGAYYNREIQVALEVESIRFQGGALEVLARVTGTEDEGLLRWVSGSPGVPLRCHICLPDCSNVPDGDDILHLKRVKQRGREAPGWSDNLKEASGMEELRRLAARSDAAARGEAAGREEKKRPREEAAGEEEKIKDSSESSEVRKKKKKRAFKPAGKKEQWEWE